MFVLEFIFAFREMNIQDKSTLLWNEFFNQFHHLLTQTVIVQINQNRIIRIMFTKSKSLMNPIVYEKISLEYCYRQWMNSFSRIVIRFDRWTINAEVSQFPLESFDEILDGSLHDKVEKKITTEFTLFYENVTPPEWFHVLFNSKKRKIYHKPDDDFFITLLIE